MTFPCVSAPKVKVLHSTCHLVYILLVEPTAITCANILEVFISSSWFLVFWLLCSNALELVHMEETHLKLLDMSVVGISQISVIYSQTYSPQLYLLLFMQHIALAHQIGNHCLWDLVISCEFLQTIFWRSFQVQVGTCSLHYKVLIRFLWISYEFLVILIWFWSKFE